MYFSTTSPTFNPAFSAGLSGSTTVISTPPASCSFSAFARSLIDFLHHHADVAAAADHRPRRLGEDLRRYKSLLKRQTSF